MAARKRREERGLISQFLNDLTLPHRAPLPKESPHSPTGWRGSLQHMSLWGNISESMSQRTFYKGAVATCKRLYQLPAVPQASPSLQCVGLETVPHPRYSKRGAPHLDTVAGDLG